MPTSANKKITPISRARDSACSDFSPRRSFERLTRLDAQVAISSRPVRRVLLVEDCEPSRQLTRILLERLGCRVEESVDGAQAVQAGLLTSHDLILMDISIPIFDGFEAAHRLRAAGVQTPIVALSAYIGESVENPATVHMNGCISKPVTLDGLRGCLTEVARGGAVASGATAPPSAFLLEAAFEPTPLRTLFRDLASEDDPAHAVFFRLTAGFRRDLEAMTEDLVDAMSDETTLARSGEIAHKVRALASAIGANGLARHARMAERAAMETEAPRSRTSTAADRLALTRAAAVAMQSYREALAALRPGSRAALRIV
jgi:CheY-like chemotaxis protein